MPYYIRYYDKKNVNENIILFPNKTHYYTVPI